MEFFPLNLDSTNSQLKKKDYCNSGDVLTWNSHDDAKHPFGSYECKSQDKKRRALCIVNNNNSFIGEASKRVKNMLVYKISRRESIVLKI
jgi:hypothetical protein